MRLVPSFSSWPSRAPSPKLASRSSKLDPSGSALISAVVCTAACPSFLPSLPSPVVSRPGMSRFMRSSLPPSAPTSRSPKRSSVLVPAAPVPSAAPSVPGAPFGAKRKSMSICSSIDILAPPAAVSRPSLFSVAGLSGSSPKRSTAEGPSASSSPSAAGISGESRMMGSSKVAVTPASVVVTVLVPASVFLLSGLPVASFEALAATSGMLLISSGGRGVLFDFEGVHVLHVFEEAVHVCVVVRRGGFVERHFEVRGGGCCCCCCCCDGGGFGFCSSGSSGSGFSGESAFLRLLASLLEAESLGFSFAFEGQASFFLLQLLLAGEFCGLVELCQVAVQRCLRFELFPSLHRSAHRHEDIYTGARRRESGWTHDLDLEHVEGLLEAVHRRGNRRPHDRIRMQYRARMLPRRILEHCVSSSHRVSISRRLLRIVRMDRRRYRQRIVSSGRMESVLAGGRDERDRVLTDNAVQHRRQLLEQLLRVAFFGGLVGGRSRLVDGAGVDRHARRRLPTNIHLNIVPQPVLHDRLALRARRPLPLLIPPEQLVDADPQLTTDNRHHRRPPSLEPALPANHNRHPLPPQKVEHPPLRDPPLGIPPVPRPQVHDPLEDRPHRLPVQRRPVDRHSRLLPPDHARHRNQHEQLHHQPALKILRCHLGIQLFRQPRVVEPLRERMHAMLDRGTEQLLVPPPLMVAVTPHRRLDRRAHLAHRHVRIPPHDHPSRPRILAVLLLPPHVSRDWNLPRHLPPVQLRERLDDFRHQLIRHRNHRPLPHRLRIPRDKPLRILRKLHRQPQPAALPYLLQHKRHHRATPVPCALLQPMAQPPQHPRAPRRQLVQPQIIRRARHLHQRPRRSHRRREPVAVLPLADAEEVEVRVRLCELEVLADAQRVVQPRLHHAERVEGDGRMRQRGRVRGRVREADGAEGEVLVVRDARGGEDAVEVNFRVLCQGVVRLNGFPVVASCGLGGAVEPAGAGDLLFVETSFAVVFVVLFAALVFRVSFVFPDDTIASSSSASSSNCTVKSGPAALFSPRPPRYASSNSLSSTSAVLRTTTSCTARTASICPSSHLTTVSPSTVASSSTVPNRSTGTAGRPFAAAATANSCPYVRTSSPPLPLPALLNTTSSIPARRSVSPRSSTGCSSRNPYRRPYARIIISGSECGRAGAAAAAAAAAPFGVVLLIWPGHVIDARRTSSKADARLGHGCTANNSSMYVGELAVASRGSAGSRAFVRSLLVSSPASPNAPPSVEVAPASAAVGNLNTFMPPACFICWANASYRRISTSDTERRAADMASSKCLLLRDRVLVLGLVNHLGVAVLVLAALDFKSNRLLDGKLDGPLGNEAKIGTGEAVRLARNVGQVDIVGNRSLAELRRENGQPGFLVRKRDVDQGVQTTRPAKGSVELLWSVRGADNKDVLLDTCAIKFVSSAFAMLTTLSLAPPASPMLPPRDLAMESNSSKKTTQGAAARALSKISRMLDSDSPNHMLSNSGPLTEMKLAAHSLATAFANIVLPVPGEQDTAGRGHAKLEELLRMLDWLALDAVQTTNVVPLDVRDLDNSNLAESGGVADTESEAEVLHGDTERVQDFGIDRVLVKVNHVHLLTNLLHGSLRAERCNIGTDVTVGLGSDGLEVDVIAKLHVLGVDLEDLQTTSWVGNANVDFSVEPAEASKSRVNRVGSIGGGHDNDVASGLHSVHERQKLRDDATLDFTVGLLTLWRDGVDFIDEDDGGRVLLRLLEGFSKVGLGFTSHLGHDLRPVDQEEERASFVGNSTSHQRFTGTGRSVHQNTPWRLDTDTLEKLRVTKWQFNQFPNWYTSAHNCQKPRKQRGKKLTLRHLLSAATDIVVPNVVKVALLILAVQRLALAVDNGILRDDTVLWRVDLDNFEFNLSHTTTNGEQIALSDRSVVLKEVWLQVHVEERPAYVFDVWARVDGDNVAQSDSQVVSNNPVDSSAAIFQVVVCKDNHNGIPSLLALDEDCVATEELEGLHGVVGQGNDGVVIVGGVGDSAWPIS
ncbi:LOW QUALITY PROTEIN: hypothetical protein Dda_2800 [Drechslerella dactyloides]|uniref:Uncharacterized protein n=1 Tax=Drechslerella dactyloides TaxID=74499 RepID=A0AAD6NKM2_DREDA|nr:LOW QUALITY PROTEIN: hypothetical protein Dda_2800 [Drechslerella dactyloides]